MTKKELIEKLNEFDDCEQVYLYGPYYGPFILESVSTIDEPGYDLSKIDEPGYDEVFKGILLSS